MEYEIVFYLSLILVNVQESFSDCKTLQSKNVNFPGTSEPFNCKAIECSFDDINTESQDTFYTEMVHRDPGVLLTCARDSPRQAYGHYNMYNRNYGFFVYDISVQPSPKYISSFPDNIIYILILRIEHTELEVLSPTCMTIFLNLKELYINDNNIHEIDNQVFTPLTHLKTLNLGHNKLSKITSRLLQPLIALEELDLSHNSIESLNEESFESNLKLQNILLNNNRIQILRELQFNSLHNLVHLDISNNPIIQIDNLLLKNLINLNKLFMSNITLQNNNIEIITYNTNLRQLDVSYNNLSEITNATFGNLHNIISLNVSNNKVSHIGESSFSGTCQLTEVYLNDNEITDFPNDIFSCQKNIEYLAISNNPLNGNPLGFLKKLKLKKLYIDNVGLNNSDIIDNTHRHESYTHISASQNFLTNIIPEMFSNFSKLTYLDISNNLIENLDKGAFLRLYNLEYLKLQNNGISSLASSIFKDTTSLRYLDLSNNMITSLPVGIFENCQDLLTLNISFNKIEHLTSYHIYRLENLKELYIQNNQLSEIEGGSYLINLESVSMENNPWKCKSLFDFFQAVEQNNDKTVNVLTSNHYKTDDLNHLRHVSCDLSSPLVSLQKEVQQYNHSTVGLTEIKKQELDLLDNINTNLRTFLQEFRNMSDIPSLLNHFENRVTPNPDYIDLKKQENELLKKMLEKIENSNVKNNTKQANELLNEVNLNLKNLGIEFKRNLSITQSHMKTDNNIIEDQLLKEILNEIKTMKLNVTIENNYINNAPNYNISELKNDTAGSNFYASEIQHLKNKQKSGFSVSDGINLSLGIIIICILSVFLYTSLNKKKNLIKNNNELLLEPRNVA